jgi:dihydroorotate dehydrogenase electron transfer subunit
MLGRILRNTKIIDGHFLLAIKLPGSFQAPMPGQFVMVREKGRLDPLLGRPFSIYNFERIDTTVIIEILYKVVGKETTLLSMLKKGVLLEIYGPYGNAFSVNTNLKKVVLICGGIGMAPLTFLASHYRSLKDAGNVGLICYVGAAGAAKLVGVARIKELCPDVFISTDDGSMGHHGFVTDIFSRDIASYDSQDTAIYACGPRPMMKRLSEMLALHVLPCQVSLEERMACGVGACLGCSIETRAEEGKREYKRVCKEGPVFDIHDIVWN